MPRSAKNQTLRAIMAVTTIVLALFAVPLGLAIERLLEDRFAISLEHRADIAARELDLTDPIERPDSSELPAGKDRFAVYTALGQRQLGRGPQRLEAELQSSAAGTIEIAGALIVSVPLRSGETTLGWLRSERSQADVDNTVYRAWLVILSGSMAVLCIGWLIANRFANRIGQSAQTLQSIAHRLGEAHFSSAETHTGIREFDEVLRTLAATSERLEAMIQREQAFSADVSHQLRTPLTGLRTALETELAFPRPDPSSALIESLDDVDRLERTVVDLLAMARNELRNTTDLDVVSTVSTTIADWRPEYTAHQREIEGCHHIDSLIASGNAALLRQALDIVLDNALRHGQGKVTISVEALVGGCVIAITDQGPGLPDISLELRTPMTRRLGLSLATRAMVTQGGRLIVSRHQPFTEIQLVLSANKDNSALEPNV
jgi:signal transduction histidine kinase